MSDVIAEARGLLQNSQEQQAVELLEQECAANPQNVAALQLLGEALLEVNDVEKAYGIFSAAIELDPQGAEGVEKFLYMGQIIGGLDGIGYLETGLVRLADLLNIAKLGTEEAISEDPVLLVWAKSNKDRESLVAHVIAKINQAIFAEIDIWMTDLCMEPEAELRCEALITQSLQLDSGNAEAHALLALIRVSQQRNDDAREAISKLWELFTERKTAIEQKSASEESEEDVSAEWADLLQPLLNLSKLALEVGLYDLVPQVCAVVSDINDNALDGYYYEALAYTLQAKTVVGTDLDGPLDVVLLSTDQEVEKLVADAKLALTQAYRVLNSNTGETSAPELVDQVNDMLNAFGGPVMAELMPTKVGDDEEIELEE